MGKTIRSTLIALALTGVSASAFAATLKVSNIGADFWGAATGPGSDPADNLCGNTAAIAVSSSATKAAPIKLPPVK